jgi:hypothetical protein
MVVPEVYELFYKVYRDVSVGVVMPVSRGVLIRWADGVVEYSAYPDVTVFINSSYGEQYILQQLKETEVVRYCIKEIDSGEMKGWAFSFNNGQVVIDWADKTLEVWDKLDAALAQYCFQYTFDCLDR